MLPLIFSDIPGLFCLTCLAPTGPVPGLYHFVPPPSGLGLDDEGPALPPWLSASPPEGMVPASESRVKAVILCALGLSHKMANPCHPVLVVCLVFPWPPISLLCEQVWSLKIVLSCWVNCSIPACAWDPFETTLLMLQMAPLMWTSPSVWREEHAYQVCWLRRNSWCLNRQHTHQIRQHSRNCSRS